MISFVGFLDGLSNISTNVSSFSWTGVMVRAGVRVRAEVRFKAVACDNQRLKKD